MLEFPAILQAKAIADADHQHSEFITEVLKDFWICCVSREASLAARKEVLTGKAKFAIIGDGKEVPQVAMARAFRQGDYRTGYYRDQTLMFALGVSSVEDFFAQLYADTDNDPFSGGRQMNSHYATPFIDKNTGEWLRQTDQFNISSDISCTGGQVARALGLALASKKYREMPNIDSAQNFSEDGNEVCFCTIGDASTSEGPFWESLNAAAVLQVPLAVAVWDDGYGISVPIEYQTVKKSISKALAGFGSEKAGEGIHIYKVHGWDYPTLIEVFEEGIAKMRIDHTPALFHIDELTQPQGHSTSGSHERYKSKERLDWEKENDCIVKMQEWMEKSGIAKRDELESLAADARDYVKKCRQNAWEKYTQPLKDNQKVLENILDSMAASASPEKSEAIESAKAELRGLVNPVFSELAKIGRKLFFQTQKEISRNPAVQQLQAWIQKEVAFKNSRFHTHLHSELPNNVLNVSGVAPTYDENPPLKTGYEVLNAFFDYSLQKHPELMAFGEDVGVIGGVNQAFLGMQKKYGEERVFDTGIREWSIIGQAIGLAQRGLRPIAEIQYLDYIYYAFSPLVDDLATLRYRTDGIQKAPVIVRTRGHRLEGIWHSGSPMGTLVNALRGIYVIVPRNMVQAAGFYTTLLQSDEPAIMVEPLNAFRLREKLPSNIGEYRFPLGVPEVMHEGSDVTLVTYGSCVRIAQEGLKLLENENISVELIDIQTLTPFDIPQMILKSLKKTNKIIFMDEDIPGGATAYMMQEVLEKQGGYQFLDAAPKTLTAAAHRPPFGSDGDYFSKPNAEDVYEVVRQMMVEAEPHRF